MSGSCGVSTRRRGGENRFYNPPPMRKQKQQKPPSISKRMDHEDCATSLPRSSETNGYSNSTNLDRFLEFTTPLVSAQCLSKTSIRGCRGRRGRERERGLECPPYFVLQDLWDSFKEWSAYGAGVPLLLNGNDSVIQYYVPYLSGIQLYVDPSRPSRRQMMHGEESDTESSRETSSDGSDCDFGIARRAISGGVLGSRNQLEIADANIHRLTSLSLRNRSSGGSSSDESDTCNPQGQLIFEYFEHDQPFSREPLSDKISVLASQFPALRTYRSCDLSPSSWISVAWYPIYRIPTGPTLQNLDACFLTFHSLFTPLPCNGTVGLPFRGFNAREFHDAADMSLKLPLPSFGLAFYKFKVSVWNPDGVNESQKADSLLQAADNWLRLLQVNHPDFRFFVSHNTYWR